MGTENGKTGFCVGNDLTNADIAMWRMVDVLCDYYFPEVLIERREDIEAKFPLICEIANKVHAHPKIRAYMDKTYPVGGGKPVMPGIIMQAPGHEERGDWWQLQHRDADPKWVQYWADRGVTASWKPSYK